MYATKLPLELVLIMMEFADYTPRQTLEVPHILSILLTVTRWVNTWNTVGTLLSDVI